ncbi:acyl-CoA dehydrogenase [Aurantimonas aggregata]|uniref:Acyl-CoA dehydrogenase n=1 Tax=Aurantimonas aggregata TaxID=2047720 RepID=A0A6L9MMG6_9HYPH|nr:acyl-CoA dehydrogenase family protein [Aurantimonas aggregata]NDV89049.1 acyl-CoA dehydrogenase [Aurantimonas aggregata]
MSETLQRPYSLPSDLAFLASDVAERVLAPQAEEIDRDARWPREGMQALAEAGLLGLLVPERLGGHGQGLHALAEIAEVLGRACSSTAMCFAMHCVGTAVIAAKATPDQERRFLRPIAEGRHVTTLALSEPGTGSHFYLPRSTFDPDGESYVVNGKKSFITNGGHADSYVLSAVAPGSELDPGTFTCLLVEAGSAGLDWGAPWSGLGMRGNSSRAAGLNRISVPKANLLGEEGDQIWYIFEVVAPYFLTAMAGVYIGIGQAALDLSVAHISGHKFSHTTARLAENPAIVEQIADMWARLERARRLLHYAARLGDAGSPEAATAIFASKIDVADAAVALTNSAMQLVGGRGYQADGQLSRLLRDAQAAHVMSPTTHLLKSWLGRSVLGLPPL